MPWYTAEVGGSNNGVDVTISNSDDGTAGAALGVNTTTGNTQKFNSARAVHGTYAIEALRVSGTTAAWCAIDMGAGHTRESITVYFDIDSSTPTGNWGLVRTRASTGTVNQFSVYFTAARKIQVQNTAGSQLWLSTGTFAAGQYRLQINVEPGATATTGKIDFDVYTKTGTTPIETGLSVTTANLGTIQEVRYTHIGRFDGSGGVGGYAWDTAGYEPLAAGSLGAYGVTPPTPVLALAEERFVAILLGSTPSGGGAMSYGTPVWISGPTLTYSEPSDGIFLFVQTTTGGPSVYGVPVIETPGGTVVYNVTIPNYVPGVTSVYSPKTPTGSHPGNGWA